MTPVKGTSNLERVTNMVDECVNIALNKYQRFDDPKSKFRITKLLVQVKRITEELVEGVTAHCSKFNIITYYDAKLQEFMIDIDVHKVRLTVRQAERYNCIAKEKAYGALHVTDGEVAGS